MIADGCSRRWGGRFSLVLGGLLGLAAVPQISNAATPAHAHTSEFGSGWECDRGYAQQDNSCVQVVVPAHAYLDDSGDDWSCDRGYHRTQSRCDAIKLPAHAHLSGFSDMRGWDCDRGYRAEGESCLAIQVPTHGYLMASGDDWACRRGYAKQGNTDCVPVAVPAHGHLTDTGDSWECDLGYRQTEQSCEAVVVPAHGYATYQQYDTGWACNRGYRASGGQCVAVNVPANAHLDFSGTQMAEDFLTLWASSPAKGLEQFKNKFDPVWEPNYLAYEGDMTDLAVIALNIEKAMDR